MRNVSVVKPPHGRKDPQKNPTIQKSTGPVTEKKQHTQTQHDSTMGANSKVLKRVSRTSMESFHTR